MKSMIFIIFICLHLVCLAQKNEISNEIQEEVRAEQKSFNDSNSIEIQKNKFYRQNTFLYPKANETAISSEIKKFLDEAIIFLKSNPKARIRIVGHSDNTGTDKENNARSNERAKLIQEYLIKNGISRARILIRGSGALMPVSNPANEAGRKKNRRVEIVIEE